MIEITTVFDYVLAVRARELNEKGLVSLIRTKDFPNDVAQEDGHGRRAYFAVKTKDAKGRKAWQGVCDERDKMAAEAQAEMNAADARAEQEVGA